MTCSLTPFLYIFLLFNNVLDNDSEPVNEMIGKPQEWRDGEVLEPTWLTVQCFRQVENLLIVAESLSLLACHHFQSNSKNLTCSQ